LEWIDSALTSMERAQSTESPNLIETKWECLKYWFFRFSVTRERLLKIMIGVIWPHPQIRLRIISLQRGHWLLVPGTLWQKKRVFMTRYNNKTEGTREKGKEKYKKIKYFGDKWGKGGYKERLIQRSGFSHFKGFWCLNVAHV